MPHQYGWQYHSSRIKLLGLHWGNGFSEGLVQKRKIPQNDDKNLRGVMFVISLSKGKEKQTPKGQMLPLQACAKGTFSRCSETRNIIVRQVPWMAKSLAIVNPTCQRLPTIIAISVAISTSFVETESSYRPERRNH